MRRDWWATKIRRTQSYLRARVAPDERSAVEAWLTPNQLAVFDRMHVADQRHGLDVVAALRAQGVTDEELLVAGLLHDSGKGRQARLVHRVAWSLGEGYGPWVWRLSRRLPTFGPVLDRLDRHAEISARLAAGAGCSARTVDLIRHQNDPRDDAGRRLQAADEAN